MNFGFGGSLYQFNFCTLVPNIYALIKMNMLIWSALEYIIVNRKLRQVVSLFSFFFFLKELTLMCILPEICGCIS